MPSFNFVEGAGSYSYGPGVNAANLTAKDIRDANAKLAPRRQQLINNGMLKATNNDPGYQPPTNSNNKPFFDYAKWSRKELMKAVTTRQIVPKVAAMFLHKVDFISMLRKKDKEARFDRFRELPPEIRNQIYKLNLQDETVRVRPATPAISRVNKQLRAESLPIFFRNTAQGIIFHEELKMSTPQQASTGEFRKVVNIKTKEYFQHAARQGWLKDMRLFQLRMMRSSLDRNTGRLRSWDERFYVKFSPRMQRVRVWTRQDDETSKDRLPEVRPRVDKIHKTKRETLTRKDFNRMMAIFNKEI